jgi:hypothetical protein
MIRILDPMCLKPGAISGSHSCYRLRRDAIYWGQSRGRTLAIDFGGMRFIGINRLDNLGGFIPAKELHKAEQTVSVPGNADLLIGRMEIQSNRQSGDWRSQVKRKTQTRPQSSQSSDGTGSTWQDVCATF